MKKNKIKKGLLFGVFALVGVLGCSAIVKGAWDNLQVKQSVNIQIGETTHLSNVVYTPSSNANKKLVPRGSVKTDDNTYILDLGKLTFTSTENIINARMFYSSVSLNGELVPCTVDDCENPFMLYAFYDMTNVEIDYENGIITEDDSSLNPHFMSACENCNSSGCNSYGDSSLGMEINPIDDSNNYEVNLFLEFNVNYISDEWIDKVVNGNLTITIDLYGEKEGVDVNYEDIKQ